MKSSNLFTTVADANISLKKQQSNNGNKEPAFYFVEED